MRSTFLILVAVLGSLRVFAATNHAPVFVGGPEASPNTVMSNQRMTFTAVAQDADGDALSYRWDFSDGWAATGRVAQRRFPGGIFSMGATVTVSDAWGAAATSSLTVVLNNNPAIWAGPVQEPLGPDGWALGQKRALFMVLSFPDFTPTVQSNFLLGITGDVSNFYAACSHGLCGFAATVAPVIAMNLMATNYGGANSVALMCEARTKVRSLGLVPEDFDFNIFIVPSGKGLPGNTASIANQLCFLNASGTNIEARTLAHEVGHCLGLQHANAWVTRERSVIGAGANTDYGNPFDCMGGVVAFPANHFGVMAKLRLGWAVESNAPVITNSTTIRLSAHDVTPWTATNVLAVRANAGWRRYWIEHRRLITNNMWVPRGVLLLADPWPNTDQEAVLLDATPGTAFGTVNGPSQDADKLDSVLLVGRTFADPDGALFITPLDASGTSNAMDLAIQIGPFPTNLPPTVSIIASATNVAAGTPVNFTATASDPNGDALAYYWSFGDNQWLSTNGAAISKSWSGTGDYLARCEVTDLRGGVASHQLLIRVGAPTTFRMSGIVTLSNQPLEGVRVAANTNLFAWTDSSGTYTIPNVPAGPYTTMASRGDALFTRTFTNPVGVAANVTGLNWSVLFNNTAPAIIPPANQVIAEDGLVENLAMTITDAQIGGREVLLTMASDNPTLLDATDFRFQPNSTNGNMRRVSFRPKPGASGFANITLTASDGLASTTALFSVTVVATNDRPLSVGADVSANGPRVVGALAGVTDDEGDPVTARLMAPPLFGTALLQPDGSVLYVPNPGFTGFDTLAFSAVAGTTGNVAGLVFNVTASTSTWFDVWSLQNFGAGFTNPAIASALADPDGDGNGNLLEFASGTHPTNVNPSPLFLLALSNGNPSVYYQRDEATTGTVSWRIESASDPIGPWSNRAGASQPIASNGTLRTIQFVPSAATNECFRLTVTQP